MKKEGASSHKGEHWRTDLVEIYATRESFQSWILLHHIYYSTSTVGTIPARGQCSFSTMKLEPKLEWFLLSLRIWDFRHCSVARLASLRLDRLAIPWYGTSFVPPKERDDNKEGNKNATIEIPSLSNKLLEQACQPLPVILTRDLKPFCPHDQTVPRRPVRAPLPALLTTRRNGMRRLFYSK